jgi:hypothetical protein
MEPRNSEGTNTMETPQDFRPAAGNERMPNMILPGRVDGKNIGFKFQHKGKAYQLAPSNILGVGFARRIRKLGPEDQLFTVLEALADDETMAAIDDMGHEEFHQFQWDWQRHNADEGIVPPGE